MMESILKNSDTVLGVEWKSGPNSSELLLEQEDGRGRMVFHPLFPGVTLAFIQVSASNWPESEANAELRPLLINYCVAGRSELLLDDGAYIYLKENDFAVSEQTAQDGYIFPTRLYQALNLFDIEQLSQNAQELMSAFELDFTLLRENYCRRQKTYINEADSTLTAISATSGTVGAAVSILSAHLYAGTDLRTTPYRAAPFKNLRLLYGTSGGDRQKSRTNPHRRSPETYPRASAGGKFSVGETSLKNYFRGVYGQNISTYLREVRMKAAAEFLAKHQPPHCRNRGAGWLFQSGKVCSGIQEAIRHIPVRVSAQEHLERLSHEKL